MNELIKAYFEKHDYINIINSVGPVIKNDEQHWEVEYDNMCCASGVDFELVAVSDLLVFLHSGKVNYLC